MSPVSARPWLAREPHSFPGAEMAGPGGRRALRGPAAALQPGLPSHRGRTSASCSHPFPGASDPSLHFHFAAKHLANLDAAPRPLRPRRRDRAAGRRGPCPGRGDRWTPRGGGAAVLDRPCSRRRQPTAPCLPFPTRGSAVHVAPEAGDGPGWRFRTVPRGDTLGTPAVAPRSPVG